MDNAWLRFRAASAPNTAALSNCPACIALSASPERRSQHRYVLQPLPALFRTRFLWRIEQPDGELSRGRRDTPSNGTLEA